MRKSNQLTALKVAKLATPGRYGDGNGLWLQVGPAGNKSWLFRYQRAGKARQMGLGPVHTVSLVKARDSALEARRALLAGIDPIEAKARSRAVAAAQAAGATTFKEAAEAYIAAHKATWKNRAHAAQWPASLQADVYPVIGEISVGAIDTALVLKVLEPIWKVKPESASRIRGRIELVLDWAKARGARQGDNPARWRGHLDKLLPAKSKIAPVKHHPALPYRDLPGFMRDLRAREGVAARALEFTILSCTRTGETIGAKWPEFNLKTKIWTIPAARMKAARDHIVPLSDQQIILLKKLPREKGNDFVFIGRRSGEPLSNMAMLAVLKALGRDDLTVHGFRSTFRDYAGEVTSFPREVAELAIAHIVADETEAAYQRGVFLAKRRRLAQTWANYCTRSSKRKRR